MRSRDDHRARGRGAAADDRRASPRAVDRLPRRLARWCAATSRAWCRSLGNLLNNAAKYTNDGGRIHLSVRRDGRFVEIRVKDNGIGIAPDSQSEAVQPVLAPGRRPTIARRAGSASASRWCASSSRCTAARSPCAAPASARAASSSCACRCSTSDAGRPPRARRAQRPSAAPRIASWSPTTIRDALESLALLLECDGHEVWKAANGAEAFELAAKCQPHLALLDIGMPVLDGYEAARRIRSETWGKAHDAGRAERLGSELRRAALARLRLRYAPGEAGELRRARSAAQPRAAGPGGK